MYIQRILPESNFTWIDPDVLTDLRLSDGAKVLYCLLTGMSASTCYTDEYLMHALSLSRRAIATRKRELRSMDLLATEQIAARVYHSYLGTTDMPASKIMKAMKRRDRA